MERFFNQPAREPSVGMVFSVGVATSLPLATNPAEKSAKTNFDVAEWWLNRWFSTDDLLRCQRARLIRRPPESLRAVAEKVFIDQLAGFAVMV